MKTIIKMNLKKLQKNKIVFFYLKDFWNKTSLFFKKKQRPSKQEKHELKRCYYFSMNFTYATCRETLLNKLHVQNQLRKGTGQSSTF